jgi:hypothetical protein
MEEGNREELAQALAMIDRSGAFFVSGSAPALLPGLEVDGLGPIGLPLGAKQAKDLIKLCEQAPYGKGTKTAVDTSVRRVWRMAPDRFRLTNPDWERFLAETVAKVQQGLGLEKQKLGSHLYDLLLYEPGSFFLPHRDGEKLDRMVATLVIQLPSIYEGGELVVRHDGQEQTIDFSSLDNSRFPIHYAAFYADCEHEVRPLRKGYRLCLVYNLTLARSKKPIRTPRDSEHVERLVPLLRRWAEDDEEGKLVVTLDHQYTKDGVAWDALKGVDRARARILESAARQAGCKAYLGLLTFWESGSAEYADGGGYGYRRRGYWRDDDDDEYEDEYENASEYEMEEVFDSSLTADHFSDSEGRGLPIGTLNVEEEELLDPEALKDVDPEEEFEGYTGNEGMTLERWYRHAAIFIWPEERHLEVICGEDSRRAVPVLIQMVAKWQKARGADAAAQKARCIDLARTILARWPEDRYAHKGHDEPETGDLLETLAALEDPALIAAFLGDALVKDASAEPGESLGAVCQKYGWTTFERELLTLMKGTTNETLERNVALFEQIGTARPRKNEGWKELSERLAQALAGSLETIDGKRSSYDWRSKEVDRAKVLAGLVRGLIAAEQDAVLSRILEHALAKPKVYPLTDAHMKALEALRPWLKKNLKKPSAALAAWLAACRGQLEALTASAPREPADFRRKAAIDCKCADCTELKRFLQDPRESVHRFSAREDRRRHLEYTIRENECDLDFKTERRGSPYTLVCTKNTASHQKRLKTYHQDQEYLKMVRAVEASLPR